MTNNEDLMAGSHRLATVLLFSIYYFALISTAFGAEVWPELTKAPSFKANKVRFKTTQAVVNLPIAIDLQQIKAQSDAKLPQLLHTIDETRTGPCVDLLVATKCLKVDLAGWVKRNGELTIDGRGNQLFIRLPLKSQITASGTGDLSGLKQTGQGAITVDINVSIAMSADWQPLVTVTTDYQWDVPFYVELAGVKISLRSYADIAVNQQLARVKSELMAQLKAQINLRAMANKAWQQAQQPIMLDKQSQLWFKVEPQQAFVRYVGIRSQQVDQKVLKQFVVDGAVVLGLQAKLGQFPVDAKASVTLPDLSPASDLNGFQLRAPVIISYQQIADQIKQKLAQLNLADWRFEDKELTIVDIEVYPHRSLLILALKLGIKAGQHIQPLGLVHLRAKPVIDRKTQSVYLKGLSFSGEHSHSFWHESNSELTEKILAQLKLQTHFDYGDMLSQLKQAAKAEPWHQLNEQLSISGQLAKVNLYKLVPIAQGLMVDIGAKGEVSAQFKFDANQTLR